MKHLTSLMCKTLCKGKATFIFYFLRCKRMNTNNLTNKPCIIFIRDLGGVRTENVTNKPCISDGCINRP